MIIIGIIICNIHIIVLNFHTVLFWCEYRYFMVSSVLGVCRGDDMGVCTIIV
jgi:hypothetical protein